MYMLRNLFSNQPNAQVSGFGGKIGNVKSGVIELDMSEVIRNMGILTNQIMPAKIRKGLTAAGNRLMIDAVLASPTVPIRRGGYGGSWTKGQYGESFTKPAGDSRIAGELRASGALFVDGVKKRDTLHYGEGSTGKYQPELYGGTPIPKNSHEACIVFNAPYAAEQHEEWPKKTQAGAGTNYLGGKLTDNAMKYIKIVADEMKL